MASNSSNKTANTKCELPNNPFTTILQVMAPPFSPQLFSFKPPSSTSTTLAPLQFLHNLHQSISSAANEFLHFLHFSATHSNNPFINKLLSFASHLQHFSQVHYRNHRSSNFLASHNFAAVLPGDSIAVVVVGNGIMNFLNIYNTLLVVRLVLTWFPNTPPQIVSPLSTLCDPYLNIFRGIIPPLGGTLDLSPILAFLVLNAFTSAAAALPAELPPVMASHEGSTKPGLSDLTTSQRKWHRRLQSKRSGTQDGPN